MALGVSIQSKTSAKTIGGLGVSIGRTADLSTSEGLQQLAVQSGLQKRVEQVMSTKGEKPKEIFSGGFISDIFDTLNVFQYGVVGLLKGKGFSEGVKTRQSWSDKDALGDNGLPGVVAGIALDIACDPLTYIAPYTIIKKIPFLMKAGKAIKAFAFGKQVEKTFETASGLKKFIDMEGGTKLGKWFGDKFIWMFGKDPIYKEAYERSIKNIAVGTQNVITLPKGVQTLTPEIAGKLLTRDKTGRIARVGNDILKKTLDPESFEIARKANDSIESLGKQLVKEGVLSEKKYLENINEYLHNFYTEYELMKKKGLFGFMKVGIKGIKKRVPGLTPEAMAKLGQIDNPAYLYMRTQIEMIKDLENAKLFKQVNKLFGSDIVQEGFKQLPKTQRLGTLANKFVPENIFNAIQEITEPIKDIAGKELMANFKFFKVVMSPAAHGRNMVSNKILNWWKLGMNPLDPRVIKTDAISVGEIFKKGGKWINEAKTAGYGLDTFAANELGILLDSKEAFNVSKKLGKSWNTVKSKLGNIYQGEENFAKLSAFIFGRTYKGLGIEDAWKAAESATFNYAQVTPFVRKLRTALWGFPFITFTYKATPVAIETALKAPQRISVFGKIKQAIENQSDIKETERERASEPGWIRDGFYIKLPIKDKHGRSAYFDLTYIIPFGDLVSGQYFTRQISRETGLPESVPASLAEKAPLFNAIKEMSRNQDFYGDKIWKDSDTTEKQLGDIMRYLTKAYLPPLVADQIPGGYMASGERRIKGIGGALNKEQEIRQQRTLMEEMLRNIGLKIQPIDADIQETYMNWEKRKAMETLLSEAGVTKQFERTYIPK